MSFDLFVVAGGYWSRDGFYHGGETHSVGKTFADSLRKIGFAAVVMNELGYEENMCNVAWFPPENNGVREDIDDDEGFRRAAHFGVGSGALTLYVVRCDDPYLETRMGPYRSFDEEPEDGVDDQLGSNGGSNGDSSGTGNGIGGSFWSDGGGGAAAGGGEGNGNGNVDGNANVDGTANANGEARNEVGDEVHIYSSDDSGDGKLELDDRRYKDFVVGQEYRTIESFKDAVNKYAVKKKKNIKFKKSDSSRVLAVCAEPGCSWKIFASINSSSCRVVVRTLGEQHSCTWCGTVSLLTSTRIAALYMEDFRGNPDLPASALQKKLMKKNIYMSWTKCERARLKCLGIFDKEQKEQFARLHDYVYELQRSNPGSTVECEVRQSVFNRFYVCFAGLKDGWKAACRRILHVDGTFLKWRMNGMLLVACGRDPNDQMFPIAWGIVDVESKDSWKWFFEHLAEDLELGTGNGLTLASDQQKGLIGAVRELLPYAEHRMCARHVYACWKRRHSGTELQDMFWAAADCYYPLAFERKMKELKEFDGAAWKDLKISVFYPWSRAFFSEFSKCDAVENNLGESFNAAIRVARTKPIVEMLEEIRKRVMVGNEKKRSEAERVTSTYTPRAVALLDWQIDQAKHCYSLPCGLGKYEVKYKDRDSFVVHLKGQVSCTCRYYLISGIPCCHICSALRVERHGQEDPKNLISCWFTTEKLRRCYQNGLNPINGMNLWKITTTERVYPPPFKSPGGRPKGKKRKREKGEKQPNKLGKRGIKMHCSNCGEEGHTKVKCKNPKRIMPPKKPPGRPRVKKPVTSSQSNPSSSSQHISVGSSQPVGGNLLIGGRSDGVASSSQPNRSAHEVPFLHGNETYQESQDVPSLSAAPPKRKRGRPRKDSLVMDYLSQPVSEPPTYDQGPNVMPRVRCLHFLSCGK